MGKKRKKRKERSIEERGRSWDRFSQAFNIEENKDRRRKQKNKTYRNNIRYNEEPQMRDWSIEERSNIWKHNNKSQTSNKTVNKKEEESLGKRIAEVQTQMQGKGTFVGDILGRILERLERLEETSEMALESLANRS